MSEPTAVTGADVPSSENLLSPGATIRRTRERAGLSLEDLAAQMKLAKNTLDALERDDFDQLKEPVYVRGYYRKCAKVLPVAEQELIAAYEARVKPKAPPTPNRIILAGGVSSGVRKNKLKPGIFGVVAAAILIGFLAWNVERRVPAVSADEDMAEAVLLDEEPALPAERAPTAAAPAMAPTIAPSAKPVPAPAAPAPSTAVQAAKAPSIPATPAPIPAIQAPGAGAAPKPAAGAAAATAPSQLVVGFDQPSWVRVEDSRNRTLVIGLVRAGERQVLDGEPPYTVFLGNAAQARVEYAGQPIDITRYIRENGTARFTVP